MSIRAPDLWSTREIVVAPSAARTATLNPNAGDGDQINNLARGCHVIIDVTGSGTGGLTPHLQGKEPASGAYYDILVGTKITATGIVVLKLYPGLPPSSGAVASDVLPHAWRVQVVPDNSSSWTYSVGAVAVA